MMFLNSCSTQDDNSKNAVAANAKNVEKRLAAAAPGPSNSDPAAELVFINSSTDKTLSIYIIGAVGKVPVGSPAVMVDSKGQMPSSGNLYLNVLSGQTVRVTNFINVTTTLNSTGAVLTTNNSILNWNIRSLSTGAISTNPSQTVFNTRSFTTSFTSVQTKYSKWDHVSVEAFTNNGNRITGVFTINGNAPNEFNCYMNANGALNANGPKPSVLVPSAVIAADFGTTQNGLRVLRTTVDNDIIFTASNF